MRTDRVTAGNLLIDRLLAVEGIECIGPSSNRRLPRASGDDRPNILHRIARSATGRVRARDRKQSKQSRMATEPCEDMELGGGSGMLLPATAVPIVAVLITYR